MNHIPFEVQRADTDSESPQELTLVVTARDLGMGRIGALMILFGLLIGLSFPMAVAGTIHWQPGGEIWFRLACLVAGILVGGFAYGVARLTLYRTNQRLARLAALDLLTDLVNHRHFVNLLGNELRRALREGNPVSLVVADVDRFKEVNDHHGHLVGDQVLVSVAKCFKEAIRPYDIAGRIGGDEFAIILPGVHKEQAAAVAHRLGQVVAEATLEGPAPVTVSLGVASYPADAETNDLLVKRADDAMYEAKRRGRDTIASGSPRSAPPLSESRAAILG